MSSKLFAILTILLIGVVSFIIGKLLTNLKWKKKYLDEETKFKLLEEKKLFAENTLKEAKEKEQNDRNNITSLVASSKAMDKKIKDLEEKVKNQSNGNIQTNLSYNELLKSLNAKKEKVNSYTFKSYNNDGIGTNNVLDAAKFLARPQSRLLMLGTKKVLDATPQYNGEKMKQFIIFTSLLMLSLFGTNLTDFALSIWVLNLPNESISSFTLIWFFEAFPPVILGLFIGGLVDRWDKKKILVLSQLVAGIACLCLIIFYYLGFLLPCHIMVVAGISSIASAFAFSAFLVITQALVPKDQLLKVESLVVVLYTFIEIGVPILSPVFYKLIGLGNIFLIDMITFLVPVICFLLINFEAIPKSTEAYSIKKDIDLAKDFFLQRKGLLYLMGFDFIGGFLLGLIQVLFIPMILDFSDEYTLSIIMSIASVGTLMGAGLMSTIDSTKIQKPIQFKFFVYIVIGLLFTFFSIHLNTYTLAAYAMLILALFSVEEVVESAFSLTIIPMKIQGRIDGFTSLITGSSAPIAFLISGVLVDFLKPYLENNPTILSHLPGTSVTSSIVALYFISGILLTLLALFFRRKKVIIALDVLYKNELTKERNNKVEVESNEKLAKEIITIN